MRTRKLFMTTVGGVAAAALLVAGCGSSGAAKSNAPAGAGAAGPAAGSAAPAGASPTRPPLPVASGPVLHGIIHAGEDYRYQAQLISADTSTALPGVPVPAGKTAVLIRVKVSSDPVDRTGIAPNHQSLAIKFPGCSDCSWMEYASPTVPESDLLEGTTMGRTPEALGKMEANMQYYKYFWQFVPEGTDLSSAQWCTTSTLPAEVQCAPLGKVTPLTAHLAADDLH
ncbi:hypothetical protein [Kitasatospora sp. NPDC097691]|uniref:hypothetical protein n=1 Tax=Kitasatospora sp. NPDC097691 TaxID=3157231 RepID=UPI0033278F5A